MSKLIDRREELRAKQSAMHDIWEAAGPDMDLGKVESLKAFSTTAAKAAEVKRLNDEMSALGIEVENLVTIENVAAESKARDQKLSTPVGNMPPAPGGQREQKSIGQMFVESKAYRDRAGNRGPEASLDFDAKTLMSTTAGWAPLPELRPGFVPSAQRQPTVTDVIPTNTTNNASIIYMLETTFTNNAAERTEGANNAGEAALALTATTATVRQIPVWLPVTQEQMDDVPYIQGYINNRLGLMLRQRLSSEILVGNNAPPNLGGLITLAGLTQAKAADPTPDAVYKAMTQIRVTGRAEPNATIWHPNDWQDVRLLRTADGVYIWGSPADPGPGAIWGLPVVQDTACTENTAVVVDTSFTELVMRQGITVEMTDSHAGLFIQYTVAIRAAIRAAFIVYRTTAVATVTGI